jgi:hypothetical protein
MARVVEAVIGAEAQQIAVVAVAVEQEIMEAAAALA